MTIILYEKIYSDICSKTEDLIVKEDWEEIEKLFRISPKQISLFSQMIEEKVKNSQLFTKPPLRKRNYEKETPIDYYSYTWVFEISIVILKKERSFFTQEFQNGICSKIFSFMKENHVNSAACEHFAQGLFETIKTLYFNELVEVPNLLIHMIKVDPKIGIDLFSDIVEKGYYELGFDILRNKPDLIDSHNDDVRKLFENIILNDTQLRKYTHPLIEKDNDLKLIIEEHRLKLKYEFYSKLVFPELNQVDKSWLIENSRSFSFCLNLFDDGELKNIIKRLLDLNIEYSYENKESIWIIHSLLEIGWSRKRELFDEYLDKLTELKYRQVVRGYFFQFPEKIKDNQDLIFKLQYFSLDLLERRFEFFQLENPVDLFKDFLHNRYNILILRKIFYQQYPDLREDFNQEIINYLNQIDVSSLNNSQEHIIYYVDNLLEIIYGYYTEYVPEFDIRYFQEVLSKFLSVEWIAKNFNPITSFYLSKNIDNFDMEFQEKIVMLLVDNNKLTCIENLLNVNYNGLKPHLGKILEYNPKEPLESIHLVKVISKILKNSIENQEIYQKALDILRNLEDCPEKVEIYTFLGDLEQSKSIFNKLLDREFSLPYAINLALDYNLIQCEITIKDSQKIDSSILLSEIEELDTQIQNYNSDSTTLQNFTFKKTALEARLYLYSGLEELQNNNAPKSVSFFEQAIKLFNKLKSTKVIKETTKSIFGIYHDISMFFKENMNKIYEKLGQSVDEANQFLVESLNQLTSDFDQPNIQITRIQEDIQNLRFEPSTNTICQLNFEIPTKFCPKPPLIYKSTLIDPDGKLIQEWDEKRQSQIDDPIEFNYGSNKFILEIEFKEKEKYYDFNIEIEQDAKFDISQQKIETDLGKIRFVLNANSGGFNGIRDFTLLLKENDLCGFNFNLHTLIIHKDYASLEEEIIKELIEKIPKYKDHVLQYSDYLGFLKQFDDHPEIRSGVLMHILKRLPNYHLKIDEIITELKKEVQKIQYEKENDDLLFCILNQLEAKSPSFCQYLTKNYIKVGRYNIQTRKSTTLLKNFGKNPPSKTTHIIFLDDTIGSGSQFVKYYNSDFKPIYEKYNLDTNSHLNFHLIAAKGSYESIQYISQNTIFPHTNLHYCQILRSQDKAFNSKEWKEDQLLDNVKNFLKQKDERNWDGYKEEGEERGLEYLVVNEWIVPNNTIGCLWNKKGKWNPLFPRE